MSKKIFLFNKKDHSKESLFDFLKAQLKEKKVYIPDGFLRKYIEEGFVQINDRSCRNPQQAMFPRYSVAIAIKLKELKKFTKPPSITYNITAKDILFEDNDLIIVNKPYGLPTHSTLDPDKDHLVASLKRFLKARDQKPPYLGIHHRLDKDTSGVIMFTKSLDINRDISALFEKRNIEKFYVALTPAKTGVLEKFKIENNLARGKKNKRKMVSTNEGGDHAITHFKVLRKINNYFVMEAKPETGRTHQIRVHLSEKGMAILGDPIYGPTEINPKYTRLFLHALRLEFIHPNTKQKMSIEAPLPEEYYNIVGKF